ncbi:MAG: permease [Actinobacteria bacterium]|nr:permease [Actinomycetota bacterium]
MAGIASPARRDVATARTAAILVGGLAAIAAALRLIEPGRVAWIQAALIVFGGLVIQALPFVLIGALASAAIEVFVPPTALDRLADLPRALQLPAAGLAGIAFPICECGSVPVARRLMAKGLLPSAAITFMLAAPVLNPVVIASTFVAYRGRSALWTMVIGRFSLGLVVAILVGWVLGGRSKAELLRPSGHHEKHEHVELGRPEPRWRTFFVHMGNDFLFMGRFLLLGATVAALVQTFMPQGIVSRVAGVPILDIVVMMGLAAVLSLCSESDAFIAASFVQFGPAAQLAFLVFGPMVDFKLGALYAGTFGKATLRTIVISVGAATLVGALWVKVLTG